MEASQKCKRTSDPEGLMTNKVVKPVQCERDQALADLFVIMGVSKSGLGGTGSVHI